MHGIVSYKTAGYNFFSSQAQRMRMASACVLLLFYFLPRHLFLAQTRTLRADGKERCRSRVASWCSSSIWRRGVATAETGKVPLPFLDWGLKARHSLISR